MYPYGWVSWPLFIFVFLASFLALWWPNIWLKMGFPEPFEKLLAQFISYLTFTLMGWVSWPLYIFVFLASFSAPLVATYLVEYRVSGTFCKNYWFHSLHTWHVPLGGECLDPYTFSCSEPHFRPSGGHILAENGVSGIKKKPICSIHYILGIYPYGVSLLTPIHFRVLNLIFGPLVAKYVAENGVSGTFWKNYWLN